MNRKAHWERKSRLLQREGEMKLGTRNSEQKDIKSIKNNCKYFLLLSRLFPLNFFMAQQWRVNCSCLHFKRVSLGQNYLLLFFSTRESNIRFILILKSICTFNYLHWAVNSEQWALSMCEKWDFRILELVFFCLFGLSVWTNIQYSNQNRFEWRKNYSPLSTIITSFR